MILKVAKKSVVENYFRRVLSDDQCPRYAKAKGAAGDRELTEKSEDTLVTPQIFNKRPPHAKHCLSHWQ